MKIMELSGLIHSKYHTESEMADAMGWSRQRLNALVNARKEPSLQDAVEISVALDKPLSVVAGIFLRSKSPNGDC